ncbi:hypothetical protein ACUXK4_004538 [Methylorubrum extorquens]
MTAYVVPLATLQQPITQDMLVDDGEVLRFTQTLKRGAVPLAEVELRNPGFSLLQQVGYLAVVETPTGLLADAEILCRARMVRVPEDVGSLKAVIYLECAPSTIKEDLRVTANNSVLGAGIDPYVVRVVPDPGPGVIALAFAPTVAGPWDRFKAGAVAVQGFFQQDLVRTPRRYVSWQVLTVTNAVLTLTVPDSAAARDAARTGAAALIGVSGDRDPTHATLYVAGKVMAVKPAPGGKIDVVVNLADTTLADAGIAKPVGVDPTSAALPFYDPLFPGNRDDLTSAAIEARYADWHVHPVTHAITLQDRLAPLRRVDLADLGVGGSQKIRPLASPVKRVKAKLVVEYAQRSYGRVDLASLVALVDTSTLQQDSQLPASESGGDLNFGWGDAKTLTRVSYALGPSIRTGRTLAVTYRDDVAQVTKDANGNVSNVTYQQGVPYTLAHAEFAAMVVYHVRYITLQKSYDYNQVRREVVDVVLDVDTQDVALGDTELDLGTIQLGDVLRVPGVEQWRDDVIYSMGDRVLFYGRVYQCIVPSAKYLFVPITRKRNGGITTTYETPDWRDLGTGAPLQEMRLPSYVDTYRGRGSLEVLINRMRAAGLKRLAAMEVTKTFPWSAGRGLQLTDEISCLVRDGDTVQPVTAMPEQITKTLSGSEPCRVEVVLHASVGTGRNDKVKPTPTSYVQPGYVAAAYTTSVAPQYLATQTEQAPVVGTVGGDVEYVLTSDPLVQPVEALRLGDPSYACLSIKTNNAASRQYGTLLALAASGADVRATPQASPTTLDIAMRPLHTEGSIVRNFVCHAALVRSPKGVDLGGIQ